jgi:chitinase
MYKTGDIVMYMGKAYVCTYDNVSKDPIISTFYWSPYTGCIPPAAATCAILDKLVPGGEATFTAMFAPGYPGWVPLSAYSYKNFCDALATPVLAAFARSGNATQDKRELAAFLANVSVETANLTAIDEKNHSPGDHDFHGRGALQITGAPIYAEAGGALGVDLSGHPEMASQEQLVWKTGLWYWMLHANPSVGSPNVCHAAITQGNFGRAVKVINPLCNAAAQRATNYQKNCMLLGVDPGGNTSCQ